MRERENRYRVAVLNVWSALNPGDIAITLGLLSLIESAWPGCEVTLVSKCPESEDVIEGSFAKRGYRVIHYPSPIAFGTLRSRIRKVAVGIRTVGAYLCAGILPRLVARDGLLDVLRDADVVLVNGGGYLTSPGKYAWTGLLRSTLAPRVAGALGKRVIWCGESVWDLDGFGAAVLRGLLRHQEMIVRDPLSQSVVERLAPRRRPVRCLPDTGFYLPVRIDHLERAGTQVAITVKRLSNDSLMRELARCAAVIPRDMEILVVAQVRGPSVEDDDMPVARAVQAILARTHRCRLVDGAELGPEGLVRLYTDCLFVIATRIHSAVLAALGGRPMVIFPYERHKTIGIASSLGVSELVADPDVEGDLARKVGALLSDFPTWEATVKRGIQWIHGQRGRWVEALRAAGIEGQSRREGREDRALSKRDPTCAPTS